MFGEDLSVFFDTADGFAHAAVRNGGPDTVPVIFDRAYLEPLAGVEGHAPSALAMESSGIGHGDTLGIDGTTYTVRSIEPGDPGLVVLKLEDA